MALPLNIDYVKSAYAATEIATPQGAIDCFVRHVGDVALTSGNIVACDPLVFFHEAAPFTVSVPAGNYPVRLGVAKFSNGDERIAFAQVQFSLAEASNWQMAVLANEDLAKLGPNEIFGYPVDAGTGCFMDETGAALLRQRMAEEEYCETFIDEMEKTYVETWSCANVRLSPSEVENCIAFSSGWGDGAYASYFGYSQLGEIVCLITDFDLLPK
jgi:hypothetical protein